MSTYLNSLPTELLLQICKEVAADGLHHLVGLTRVSKRLHEVCNPILYDKDVETTSGLRSMCHGLETGLNSVVELSLLANTDPNIRIESRNILDSFFPSIAQRHSHQSGTSESAARPSTAPGSSPENGGNRLRFTIDQYKRNPVVGSKIIHDVPFKSPGEFYWTPLHFAATRGDIRLLNLLLKHGANPKSAGRGVCICQHLPLRRTCNYKDNWLERRLVTRWTPLHVALCKGNLECIEKLIRSSGLPRAIETDETVLAQARLFCEGEPELAHVTDLEISTVIPRLDPLPLLHLATTKVESMEALEHVYDMLERAGCLEGLPSSIDHLDSFGDTAFAISAFSDQFSFLQNWFRDHGADINFTLRDLDGRLRPVFNALCDCGLYENALLLMDMGVNVHKDMNLPSENRRESALNLCCGYGVSNLTSRSREDLNRPQALKLIKRLIHAGVDLNVKGELGMTALISAAETHFVDAVRELLAAKADVGAEDDDGWSALHWAIFRGMQRSRATRGALDTIQILLEHGADPNQRSRAVNAGPPLFSDIYSCDDDMSGEHVSACWFPRGDEGDMPDPPLYGFDEPSPMVPIASCLIAGGADPNIFLEDPRDLGQGSLENQLLRLRGRSLVITAVFFGQSDTLDALLRLGAFVTFQDYTLMMRSLTDRAVRAVAHKTSVVNSLIRILESPSLRLKEPHDKNSIKDVWTELLHYAVASRPKLVPVLAPHVVLTKKRGPGGKTVLHLLAQWTQKRRETKHAFDRRVDEVMFGLLRCGAGQLVDQPDNAGRLPLHVAIKLGNFYVAKALLQSGASTHIGHKKADGLKTKSPFSSAFKYCASWSDFEKAVKMLVRHGSKFKLEDLDRRSAELAEEVEYSRPRNFADKAPGKSIQKLRMTAKLVRHIIYLGADVDKSDKDGKAALHLVSGVLLCPLNEGSAECGCLQHNNSSRAPRSNGNNSVQDSDPNFVSVLGDLDMDMNGHNTAYNSDSDCENYTGENDDDADFDDNPDLDNNEDTISDADTDNSQ